MVACRNNHEKRVELLLSHGADPNICSDDGDTPLMLAVRNEAIEIVQMLIDYSADVNAHRKSPFGDKETPLLLACKYGFTYITKLLLQHNVDVNAQSKKRDTALIWASRNNHFEVIKLLLTHAAATINVNIQGSNGEIPLIYFCQKNNIEMVKLLLTHGADARIVPVGTRFNDSAMMYAKRNGNKEMIQLLHDNIIRLHHKREVLLLLAENEYLPLATQPSRVKEGESRFNKLLSNTHLVTTMIGYL
jgi:ankyrin repeat protein